jgi:glutathione S-transferase
MFAADAADAAAAASGLDEALKWLDGALDPAGPYALGSDFTIADAAMAPFALRLSVLEPLVGYAPPSGLPRFEAWRAACAARPSVKATMQPPEAGRSWAAQMTDTYKVYLADRKKMAAAAATK